LNYNLNLNIIDIKNMLGDWGLGIGDWGLGVGPQTPNPKHPNPQPQTQK
jgi:hypothetical protein